MAAHRYWRIHITEANHSFVGAGEIELRESNGGVDVTGSGTASASSYYVPESLTPANAFDNNDATSWASDGSAMPQWIKYDFGAGNAKDIVQFAYRARPADGAQSPNDFTLDYSDDDSSWTTLLTQTNQTFSNGEQKEFPPTVYEDGEQWRISVTAVDGGAVVAIAEVEWRNGIGGTDLATGGTASASDSTFGAAANAFDNSAGTFWAAASTTASLTYSFTSAVEPVEVAITARNDGSYNQAPKDFTVERWDGSTWQTWASFSGITGWTTGETRTFTQGSVAAAARPIVFVCT